MQHDTLNNSFLTQPIIELNVSEEFLIMAEANDFHTLQDILEKPLHKFHVLPRSGYRMLREFLNLLDAHGLIHLAK